MPERPASGNCRRRRAWTQWTPGFSNYEFSSFAVYAVIPQVRSLSRRSSESPSSLHQLLSVSSILGEPFLPFVARSVGLALACALQCEARSGQIASLTCAPDGPRMRLPQLARCSRDQLRRRMGQQRWRCARTWSRRRVRSLQSAAELGPTGRQLEARQRAGRRAASESTDGGRPADPATPTGCGCV